MDFSVSSCKQNTVKNTIVAVLSIAMLVVVLFSAIFVTVETFHDCQEDDCPICAMLHMCENTLNQLVDGGSVIFAAFTLILLIVGGISPVNYVFPLSTPVSNRVRMNN